jgi:ketosteroid isomerase-like protein
MNKEKLGKKKAHSEQEKLAEIEKLHKTDREASLKGDFPTLITLLTDDCVLLPPDSAPIAGKNAIQKYFDAQKDLLLGIEITEYVHDFQEIKIFGKWAYEWGYFSNTARPAGGGDPIKGSGILFRILALQDDGSWKVARSIWNIDSDSEVKN